MTNPGLRRLLLNIGFYLGLSFLLLVPDVVFAPNLVGDESPEGMLNKAYELRVQSRFEEAKEVLNQLFGLKKRIDLVSKATKALGDINIEMILKGLPVTDRCPIQLENVSNLKELLSKSSSTVQVLMSINKCDKERDLLEKDVLYYIPRALNIEVDVSRSMLTLKDGDSFVKEYLVATGKDKSTPLGNFHIINKLENPTWFWRGKVIPPSSEENELGTRWMGLSFENYGIHGTRDPDSIGRDLSHGCIRMYNQDVEELYSIVPLKTPVNIKESPSVKVLCVGDILLGFKAESILRENGYLYPFENIRSYIESADLSIGNLEAPISIRGEPVPNKRFTFRQNPEIAPALKEIGFDIFALANNHTMDYGVNALVDTLDVLKANKISYTGAGRNLEEACSLIVKEIKGVSIGVLSYTDILPRGFAAGRQSSGVAATRDTKSLRENISIANRETDFLICFFHWGTEYTLQPNNRQTRLAHLAVDYGADLVLGCHPHIAQKIEIYNGVPVIYSLGNCVFGTNNPQAKHGLLIEAMVVGGLLDRVDLYPLFTCNPEVYFQPRILEEEMAKDILNKIIEPQYRDSGSISFSKGKCSILVTKLQYVMR